MTKEEIDKLVAENPKPVEPAATEIIQKLKDLFGEGEVQTALNLAEALVKKEVATLAGATLTNPKLAKLALKFKKNPPQTWIYRLTRDSTLSYLLTKYKSEVLEEQIARKQAQKKAQK